MGGRLQLARRLHQQCPELRVLPPGTTANGNYAEFCNPKIDALAETALSQQFTDPAAARATWARVDHLLTDAAPWVPISNGQEVELLSPRVGHQVYAPFLGPLVDQMWVR
ncbi:MAG: hypothetical protein M3P18_14555 [Actinomycetota bacterium]|nr:hypothetical protein [Actinomycetota bacterium]